jgi:hypothetical protein
MFFIAYPAAQINNERSTTCSSIDFIYRCRYVAADMIKLVFYCIPSGTNQQWTKHNSAVARIKNKHYVVVRWGAYGWRRSSIISLAICWSTNWGQWSSPLSEYVKPVQPTIRSSGADPERKEKREQIRLPSNKRKRTFNNLDKEQRTSAT